MRDTPEAHYYDNFPPTLLFKKVTSVNEGKPEVLTTAVTYSRTMDMAEQMKFRTFTEKLRIVPMGFSSEGINATSLVVGQVIVYTGPHLISGGYNGPEPMSFFPVKIIPPSNGDLQK